MKFINEEIPKEKKFLFRYFKGKVQNLFIKYIVFFGDYKNFRDHTGLVCQDRWLKNLFKKYNDLMYINNQMKKNMDLDGLSNLYNGKISINKRNFNKTTI